MPSERESLHCAGRFIAASAGDRMSFRLPGAGPKYARDRVCDIRHIRLDVQLDFEARSIRGSATTTLVALNPGLDRIEFDAVEMDIARVTLGEEPVTFDNTGKKLSMTLPRALEEGEEATLRVEYSATPRRGLYFVAPDEGYPDKPVQAWTQGQDEDSRYWYPCYDYPNEKASTEVVATVPERFFALSNGDLVEERRDEAAGTKTFHWRQEIPHVTYLVTLVVGEFHVIEEEVDGIPIYSYVAPGREDDGRRSLENTAAMMRFFNERFGRYPYPRYSQVAVADFIFGGMENTTATTLTDQTIHDERAHLDFSSDELVAHELAHNWWGDWVTCRDWSHAWLNEGFATYAEHLFKAHHRGKDEGDFELFQLAEGYFQEDGGRYRRPIVTHHYQDPVELFDRHLYEKGALVLHTLKTVLGEDLFWKSIRHYLETNQGKNAETRDLQRAIEQATGRNLDAFFDAWVYGAGYPELKAKLSWQDKEGVAAVTIEQTQKEGEPFHLPLTISFEVDGAHRDFPVEVEGKEQTFHLPLPSKPTMVRVDPGGGILKKLSFPRPLPMLVRQLEADPEVLGRIEAAGELGKDASPEAVRALGGRLLAEGFWGVQTQIAKALGGIRTGAARDALLAGLDVTHPKARRAVVQALGEFRDDEVVERLLPVVAEDASYLVEAEAARALGRTRSSRGLDVLRENLGKDSHRDVIRAATLDGLAELRDDRALPLVLEHTGYGKHEQARSAACAALAKMADGRRDLPQVVDRLVRLLDDPMFRVRAQAAAALGKLRDPAGAPALERAGEGDLDGRVRRQAREALQKVRDGFPGRETLTALREEVDGLKEQNRGLRERIEKLEGLLPERKGGGA